MEPISSLIIYYIVCKKYIYFENYSNIILLVHFLQEINYPLLQSIFNDDYKCTISKLFISCQLSDVIPELEEEIPTLFASIKIFFSVATQNHSLGPIQAPTHSCLYLGQNIQERKFYRFSTPSNNSISGDEWSSFNGWLEYEIAIDPTIISFEWVYGNNGYSRALLINKEDLSKPLQKVIADPTSVYKAISNASAPIQQLFAK